MISYGTFLHPRFRKYHNKSQQKGWRSQRIRRRAVKCYLLDRTWVTHILTHRSKACPQKTCTKSILPVHGKGLRSPHPWWGPIGCWWLLMGSHFLWGCGLMVDCPMDDRKLICILSARIEFRRQLLIIILKEGMNQIQTDWWVLW